MTFNCEICGLFFKDREQCEKHERSCRERNEKLLFIHETLLDLINVAKFNKIKFGVVADVFEDGMKPKKEFCNIVDSVFDSKNQKLTVIFERDVKETKEGRKPK